MMTKNDAAKNLVSVAYLKVLWDKKRETQLDLYIPFLVEFFKKRNVRLIKETGEDINRLCSEFKDEFGFDIPYIPMMSILNRAKRKGIIEKKEHQFHVREDKLSDFNFDTKEVEDDIENLVRILKEKIEQVFPDSDISEDLIKNSLLKYLSIFDYQLLVLPLSGETVKLEKNDPNLFKLAKALNSLYETHHKGWDLFIKVLYGYFISKIILHNVHNVDLLRTKYKGLKVYLDTRIVLRVLGGEGELIQKIYVDFLSELTKAGAELCIFTHTYEEIREILEGCYKWIENPNYDPSKASITLRHFKERGLKQSDIQLILSNLEHDFNKYGIKIDYPPSSTHDQLKIDEERLKEIIIEVYSDNPYFNQDEKMQAIERDIKSISLIYRLRGRALFNNLKDAKYIFVTCNVGLNYSVYRFHNEEYAGKGFSIPPCVMDTFIGTLIWLNRPIESKSDLILPVISYNLAILQPSKDFLESWMFEINKLKEKGEITDEQYILLRDHQLARELLEEKTLGDPEQITVKSPVEILTEMEKRIRFEGEKELNKERRAHEETKRELESLRHENENFKKKIEQISNSAAIIVTLACTVLVSILIVLLSWNKNIYCKIIGAAISSILGLIGVTVKGIRLWTKQRIKGLLEKYFFR